MPIRMEKDSPERGSPGGSGGGKGGNSMLGILVLALLFLFRKPKLIIPLLLVGAIWYFFFGGAEMLSGEQGGEEVAPSAFSLGASLSEERFDQAEVFEPLAYGSYNQLPARVSLEQYAPRRRHQGRQGSCVGWASAYAAHTILQAKATGRNPDQLAFSPAYLYNQIHLDNCEGAYMLDAMKTMQQNGGIPFPRFGYDDRTCTNYPDETLVTEGRQFRLRGFNRLTVGANEYGADMEAIKQNLAQGSPVVIGMMVGGTFMSRMLGQEIWQPTQRDYGMQGYGGHAMCVIGYDDNLAGGAFQIMNSWGEEWGDRGIAWVRYPDFKHFVKEAYGLYPVASPAAANSLEVRFGLLNTETEAVLPLEAAGDIVFQTQQPIRKGDSFKVLVANSVECYVYIFGQETDGSSYVLFPYTDKHSPYCGITGTRLFPKDYSMVADELGSRDYIAFVISKEEIDYNGLNDRINGMRGNTYADKLKAALGNQRLGNVRFQAGEGIRFQAETKQAGNLVGVVLAIDKE